MKPLVLAELLRGYRLPFGTEAELQAAVARVLDEIGIEHSREFRFSPRDRIDFLAANGIGIECKIDGSPSQVLGQLLRYAERDEVQALILVTSRHTHRMKMTKLNGKPFVIVWIGGTL